MQHDCIRKSHCAAVGKRRQRKLECDSLSETTLHCRVNKNNTSKLFCRGNTEITERLAVLTTVAQNNTVAVHVYITRRKHAPWSQLSRPNYLISKVSLSNIQQNMPNDFRFGLDGQK